MSMQKKYQGLVIPMITPITAKGSLDKNAVEKIFDLFHSQRAAPFILGTTGESYSVSLEMKKKIYQACRQIEKK